MIKNILCLLLVFATTTGFAQRKSNAKSAETKADEKVIIYHVLPRLFGNTVTKNKPWGTSAENGVGKFNDFTDVALQQIRKLGVTHLLLTGVLHHATMSDYKAIGVSTDDADLVKGIAGSPFIIKDYYQVSPDLAVNPDQRMSEFDNLIKRAHKNGLKIIIDIVPNHVARTYEGKNNPKKVVDFGESDDASLEYTLNNNFYYIPGQSFEVPSPEISNSTIQNQPSGDGIFLEKPAKWSGNGVRLAKPSREDWYDSVKLNFGINPDGTKDFQELPLAYANQSVEQHFKYWEDKEIPNTWNKFRDITQFWLEKGVDGFRYESADLVPHEFYSYINSSIKSSKPDAFILAKITNQDNYRKYVQLGKMDYIYGQGDFYQTMKNIVQGNGTTDALSNLQTGYNDIQSNIVHFAESHDGPRVASLEFARNGHRGKPLMVVSATISTAPVMMYFGQEVGEQAKEKPGFGKFSTTSLNDYIGVPNHQRWMNLGKFDGGLLINEERDLREFYQRLLNFTLTSEAMKGEFREIHTANRKASTKYGNEVYSYVRWSANEKLIIVTNFSGLKPSYFDLIIPTSIINEWGLKDGSYIIKDQIYLKRTLKLEVGGGEGKIMLNIAPSESFIFKI